VIRKLYLIGVVLFLMTESIPSVLALEARSFTEEQFRTRYYSLINELRCPKCQNQNLADSNSLIAVDLRNEIYLMIEEGKSNEVIVSFLVTRYGDFVRYDPPLNSVTLILWFAPGALFLLGMIIIFFIYRSQSTDKNYAIDLKPDEKKHIDDLLMKSSNNKNDSSGEAKK